MSKIFLPPGLSMYPMLSFFSRLFFFFYGVSPRYRSVSSEPERGGLLLVVTERPSLT